MFLLVLVERDYLSAYMHVDAHECIMWQRKIHLQLQSNYAAKG
jgi:hypothetical protein